MDVNSATMRAEPSTNVPVKRRRRAADISRIDHRTKQGRRVAQLVQYFANFFGGAGKVTPITMANISRAAELITLSEAARAAALRATVFDVENLTRLESTTDRAVRRLALPDKPVDDVPDLQIYLRQLAAEEAAAAVGTGDADTLTGEAARTSEALS